MGDPILEVENLHVHFDTYEGRQRVLDGVDITIEEGETVALVGETGCGKSVTAKTVVGTLPRPPGEVVEGAVRFRGEDLLADPARHARVRAEEMGMIFQDPMSHLSPVFTVGDAMTDVLQYAGSRRVTVLDVFRDLLGRGGGDAEAERRDRCVEMLRKLQIPNPEGVMDRYPVELSGGMRQRVLIAMALLTEPPFIVADEPTTALDVTVQEQIIDLLEERVAEQDLSMLYITHNLGIAREIADRIYVMYAGTIAESGRTRPLFDSPLHPYTKGLVDSIPKLTSFDSHGIEGTIPDYGDPPSGCRFHPRCPSYMAGECDETVPAAASVGEDHAVSCLLYEDGMAAEEAARVADEEIAYRRSTSDRSAGQSTPDGSSEATSHE